MAAKRTFGWIQNPSSTDTLRNVVSLFVPGSDYHTIMLTERLPLISKAKLFKEPRMYDDFCMLLLQDNIHLPYDSLKGKGSGNVSRGDAKCSGLVQAAIDAQQIKTYDIDGEQKQIRKPYTDDWTSDGFLRWAVSIGFLDYNYEDDTCSVTTLGNEFVRATTIEERNKILGEAFLSYPPVYRILWLLSEYGHCTKFEIGSHLGFSDEPGFTSIPQNIWVKAYLEADADERKKLKSDVEGTSDKYARMICGWLSGIGWVERVEKHVVENYGNKQYRCDIAAAYVLTLKGRNALLRANGKSKQGGVSKIVYREMLASKAPYADHLRMRRAYIIDYLASHIARTYQEIYDHLKGKGIDDDICNIMDDIKGLVNIGLRMEIRGDVVRLWDDITKLQTTHINTKKQTRDDVAIVKNRVRLALHNINHKYLTLIDYAFSGKDKCREFEIYTIDLLTNELNFEGAHLGGTSKPDGIFYYGQNGVIVDNKAYSNGFTITRHMADEMTRYIQENNERNPLRNPNLWWNNFDCNVNNFYFVFISSAFKGEVNKMLQNIKHSTGRDGSVMTAENLLYFAEALKGGSEDYADFVARFGIGQEIVYKAPSLCINPKKYEESRNSYLTAAESEEEYHVRK